MLSRFKRDFKIFDITTVTSHRFFSQLFFQSPKKKFINHSFQKWNKCRKLRKKKTYCFAFHALKTLSLSLAHFSFSSTPRRTLISFSFSFSFSWSSVPSLPNTSALAPRDRLLSDDPDAVSNADRRFVGGLKRVGISRWVWSWVVCVGWNVYGVESLGFCREGGGFRLHTYICDLLSNCNRGFILLVFCLPTWISIHKESPNHPNNNHITCSATYVRNHTLPFSPSSLTKIHSTEDTMFSWRADKPVPFASTLLLKRIETRVRKNK